MIFNDLNIGLTLSGGGTKGLAHAGVLAYLNEVNIKPDMISGTSAGSIVACLYAWGFSPQEILRFIQSIDFFKWKYFTLRKAGFIDSMTFKKVFEDVFEDRKIKDLNIQVNICATDMVRQRIKIFSSETKIVDAILASCAFPGVLSPYEIDGIIYSDGGIFNHFPTDVLQGRCDFLIGSYVSPIQKIDNDYLKSIKNVMTYSLDLMQHQLNQNKFSNCDLLIQPEELATYSTFESNKQVMHEIYSIGYQSAKSEFEKFDPLNLV